MLLRSDCLHSSWIVPLGPPPSKPVYRRDACPGPKPQTPWLPVWEKQSLSYWLSQLCMLPSIQGSHRNNLRGGTDCFGSCVQGTSVHGSTEDVVEWVHPWQECELDAVLRVADRERDLSRDFRVWPASDSQVSQRSHCLLNQCHHLRKAPSKHALWGTFDGQNTRTLLFSKTRQQPL